MIYFDKSRNLLEEDKYHYELQDVAEPELFRDLYPYDEIPKVVFNYRHVPMDMPSEIWITDTTFRDGQQSTSPFTVRRRASPKRASSSAVPIITSSKRCTSPARRRWTSISAS